MVHVDTFNSREDWLAARGNRIGGSDAACIIGKNPWKSNVQLFREKVGTAQPDDLSENEAVQYGVGAEPHLRALFALDHPELIIRYQEDNLVTNDDLPFAHASLDGWVETDGAITGILEIKTATVQSGRQMQNWENRIPDHYYCQVLWYMMVTGAKEAWVQALLKITWKDEECIRQYHIRRYPQVEKDIQVLAQKGAEFYAQMQTRQEPPLILPFL